MTGAILGSDPFKRILMKYCGNRGKNVTFSGTSLKSSRYEEYPGSITDVSEFTFMVDKVIQYGVKKIRFILDRGYFSKKTSDILMRMDTHSSSCARDVGLWYPPLY